MTRCDLQEERLLIQRARQGKDQAMETLLLTNRSLLYALADRMYCSWIPREELVQAGYLGMMEAVHRFDTEKPVRFTTYALPWALGEMKRMLRKNKEQYSAASLEAEILDGERPLLDTICGSENIDFAGLDLRLALENLTREEQVLVTLRYFRDKTQKETADLLHKSQAQISKMEQRVLNRLHIMLSG